MKKIHTRVKRLRGLNTHHKHYCSFHPKIGMNRPKTFKTEESANKWAAAHGLQTGQYSLKRAKHNKKFQVVVQDGKN